MTAKDQRFAIFDSDIDEGIWNINERVILLIGDEGLNPSWEFKILESTSGETILPTNGDILKLSTKRPLLQKIHIFSTSSSKINDLNVQTDMDKINVVPNPYVVTNALEQLDLQNPLDRGPRRIYFNHLPRTCTISIYTIDGLLVNTIRHDSSIDDGIEYWDLTKIIFLLPMESIYTM